MTEIERLVEDVVLAEHSDSIPRRIAARSALLSSYRESRIVNEYLTKTLDYAEAELASLRLELSEARERQITPDLIAALSVDHEQFCSAWNNYPEDCDCKEREINMKILALRASLPTPTSDVK